MALGMRDPSYWGPNEAFAPPFKKTLSPIRTWDVKSTITDRSLTIEDDNGGATLYTTQSHFTVKRDPYVTLHRGNNDAKTAIANVSLDGKGAGLYTISLGDQASSVDQACEVVTGGNPRTRQHKFSPPAEQKDFAWRDTDQYELRIADSQVETTGRDWKLISLTADGEEDELLAVYVHNPKASLKHKAQIFWFVGVSEQVELWALAALLGLVERERKSKDKWNFSTMVGAGSVGM